MADWPLSDMHLHATRYRLERARPEMTVTNIARHLDALGCASAGIVEHLDTAAIHPVACLEALVVEFRTVSSACALYVGAELDYQSGGITIPAAPQIKERLGLDFYLAAAHGAGEGVTSTAAFIEDHHRRLMGIVTGCPYVDVVAHPWVEGRHFAARGVIEAWDWSLIPERYLREFVEAAAAHGVAIEVSRKVLPDAEDPAFLAYLALIREVGARVTTASDAHAMAAAGDTGPLARLLDAVGLSPSRLWWPGAS